MNTNGVQEIERSGTAEAPADERDERIAELEARVAELETLIAGAAAVLREAGA